MRLVIWDTIALIISHWNDTSETQWPFQYNDAILPSYLYNGNPYTWKVYFILKPGTEWIRLASGQKQMPSMFYFLQPA